MVDDSSHQQHQNQGLESISVETFFRQINWYGSVIQGADGYVEADTPYETVGQFFATFPWQGMVADSFSADWSASQTDDLEDNSSEDDSLTLEDLSALF